MMCILIHRLNMICCYNTYTPNVAVKLVNIVIRLDLKTGVFSSIFKIFLSCIRVPRLSVMGFKCTYKYMYSLRSWPFDAVHATSRCKPFLFLYTSSITVPLRSSCLSCFFSFFFHKIYYVYWLLCFYQISNTHGS